MGKLRVYEEADFDQISGWYTDRSLPTPKRTQIPKTGFIVDDVAAGFVYMTDSSVCILDSFISNPESEDTERDTALNDITMHLIGYAKACGCDLAICSTGSPAVGVRAENFGFKKLGQETVYSRGL